MGQFFPVFGYLWPIIWFLSPHLTCSRTLPNMRAQLFAKMDSTTETCRGFVHTYYGVALPPFLTPKEPYCTCADREVFLDLRRGHFISLFQHSSASVLGVSGESKTSILLHLKNTSVQPRSPSISYLSAIHWKKSRLMGESMLVK